MRFAEIFGLKPKSESDKHRIIDSFSIWTTNEEEHLLEKLQKPVRLSQLAEHEQFRIQAMIRKSLVTKIGMEDPMVVANEKTK